MFLDRHDAPGISAEELAEAHKLDLVTQEKYQVKYHTYWFDPERGTVFCLAEGPSKEAVDTVHREAHGALASIIVELDPDAPLNALLGAPPTHPAGTAYTEPALRGIVFTDICGSVAQTHALGDAGHVALLHDHDDIVRGALSDHQGREVKHTGDGIMASFSSISSAVACSVVVQKQLADRNQAAEVPIGVSVGVSAGEPLTNESEDLFGAAVQLAARLCAHADEGDILATLAVRELCVGKQFKFLDRGAVQLKGLPEPTPAYEVDWRD